MTSHYSIPTFIEIERKHSYLLFVSRSNVTLLIRHFFNTCFSSSNVTASPFPDLWSGGQSEGHWRLGPPPTSLYPRGLLWPQKGHEMKWPIILSSKKVLNRTDPFWSTYDVIMMIHQERPIIIDLWRHNDETSQETHYYLLMMSYWWDFTWDSLLSTHDVIMIPPNRVSKLEKNYTLF